MTADQPAISSSTQPPSRRIGCGLVIVLVALAVFGVVKWRNRQNVVQMFGGAEIVETIENPDRVTAQRIRLMEQEEWSDAQGGFARVNYDPLADPIEISEADARRLAKWLTYEWENNDEKGCHPSYGVRLVFERGDRHIEVWLCFECDIFTVYEPIEYETSQHSSGGGNFDPSHDELADIMRSLFPDDEAIQAL